MDIDREMLNRQACATWDREPALRVEFGDDFQRYAAYYRAAACSSRLRYGHFALDGLLKGAAVGIAAGANANQAAAQLWSASPEVWHAFLNIAALRDRLVAMANGVRSLRTGRSAGRGVIDRAIEG